MASNVRTGTLLAVLVPLALIAGAGRVEAQGLIWSLPEEGTWVRYEGTYKQTELRPNSTQGDIEFPEWVRKLWIKSLPTSDEDRMGQYRGRSVRCRWIEIKVMTGPAGAQQLEGVDTGLGGTRVYKVLIPESRVIGRVSDDIGIPVSYLPVIRGWRKLGNRPPTKIKAPVLQIYPTISLVRHYRELVDQGPEDLQIGIGEIAANRLSGRHQAQSRTTRTVHEAELWRSADVPFGLARWQVKITRYKKQANDPRDRFQLKTETLVVMEAKERGADADSDLAVQ